MWGRHRCDHHEQNIFKMGGLQNRCRWSTPASWWGLGPAALPLVTARFLVKTPSLWQCRPVARAPCCGPVWVVPSSPPSTPFRLIFIRLHGKETRLTPDRVLPTICHCWCCWCSPPGSAPSSCHRWQSAANRPGDHIEEGRQASRSSPASSPWQACAGLLPLPSATSPGEGDRRGVHQGRLCPPSGSMPGALTGYDPGWVKPCLLATRLLGRIRWTG